jgi:hypothetical protein
MTSLCPTYVSKRRVVTTTLLFVLITFSLTTSNRAYSKGVYQTGPDFIAENFNSSPQPKSLWLTPQLKTTGREIVGHHIRGMRVRYWQDGSKTLWIMEEIGKERPITIGVVIVKDHVEQLKILAFRESRGWEVRYTAFTDQYQNAKITPDYKLDQSIDGITGATLSVRAVNKAARLALFYHQQAFLLEANQVQTR